MTEIPLTAARALAHEALVPRVETLLAQVEAFAARRPAAPVPAAMRTLAEALLFEAQAFAPKSRRQSRRPHGEPVEPSRMGGAVSTKAAQSTEQHLPPSRGLRRQSDRLRSGQIAPVERFEARRPGDLWSIGSGMGGGAKSALPGPTHQPDTRGEGRGSKIPKPRRLRELPAATDTLAALCGQLGQARAILSAFEAANSTWRPELKGFAWQIPGEGARPIARLRQQVAVVPKTEAQNRRFEHIKDQLFRNIDSRWGQGYDKGYADAAAGIPNRKAETYPRRTIEP